MVVSQTETASCLPSLSWEISLLGPESSHGSDTVPGALSWPHNLSTLQRRDCLSDSGPGPGQLARDTPVSFVALFSSRWAIVGLTDQWVQDKITQ